MKHLNNLSLLAGAIMLLVGCLGSQTIGSGNIKTETRDVSGFNKVLIKTSGNLHIDQTGTDSLTIEAEDSILPLLTSDVSDGTLFLGTKTKASFSNTKPVNYKLTVKDLRTFQADGSGNTIAVNILTPNLQTVLNGSHEIRFSGKVDNQDVTILGSGKYNAFDLESKQTKIVISGTGDVFVNVKDTLDVQISGTGNIEYKGSPKVSQSISGVGSIKQR